MDKPKYEHRPFTRLLRLLQPEKKEILYSQRDKCTARVDQIGHIVFDAQINYVFRSCILGTKADVFC